MKITDETFFVDTNVLVAATDRSRASHSTALRLFDDVPRLGGIWPGAARSNASTWWSPRVLFPETASVWVRTPQSGTPDNFLLKCTY